MFYIFIRFSHSLDFQLTPDNVYDVLCAADMYLLVGLKRQCAAFIGQEIEVNNVVSVLQTARLFNLPRLEDQCAEYIAGKIDQVLLSIS